MYEKELYLYKTILIYLWHILLASRNILGGCYCRFLLDAKYCFRSLSHPQSAQFSPSFFLRRTFSVMRNPAPTAESRLLTGKKPRWGCADRWWQAEAELWNDTKPNSASSHTQKQSLFCSYASFFLLSGQCLDLGPARRDRRVIKAPVALQWPYLICSMEIKNALYWVLKTWACFDDRPMKLTLGNRFGVAQDLLFHQHNHQHHPITPITLTKFTNCLDASIIIISSPTSSLHQPRPVHQIKACFLTCQEKFQQSFRVPMHHLWGFPLSEMPPLL